MNSSLSRPSCTNSSVHDDHTDPCFTSTLSLLVFCFFLLTNLLLFVFFFYVLYVCFQQRRPQPAASSSAASYSNVFMYHSMTMQLLTSAGFACYFCGGFAGVSELVSGGLNVWSTCATGQALFNALTCLEHYLAVAHPIVYVGLRRTREVRVRNLSAGCVWLLSLAWLPVAYFLSSSMLYVILYCCVMASILIGICVCSVLILCALSRPGPGDVGGSRGRPGASKRRTSQTITVVLAVLLFKFGGNLTGMLMSTFKPPDPGDDCLLQLAAFWVDLPSRGFTSVVSA